MACYIIATIRGRGSLAQYFSSLGGELVSRGHRVIILVDGQSYDAVNKDGNPSILTWPSKRATEWRDARFLRALIRRHSPACIIGNFSAVTICVLVGWLHRTPVRAAWNHTLAAQIERDSTLPRWKLRLLKTRMRLVYKFATHFMANSKALAEDLVTSFGVRPERITVLPFLLPEPSVNRSRTYHDKIVCAGRFNPTKGQDVLIRAVPRIREACPDVIVEFVGDGPTRQKCESLAKSLNVQDACAFVGARALSDVYERMASAAVVVSPSLHEAFGLVNVEALSVGTPVVASDIDGIREIIVDGETGFLVPPNDSDSLATKIVLLLKNENLRRQFGDAARARFDSVYSARNISAHADSFERLI